EKDRSLFKIAKFSDPFEQLASSIPEEFLYQIISVFNNTQQELRMSNHAEVYLEVATIKLSQHEEEAAVSVSQMTNEAPKTQTYLQGNDEVAALQKELSSMKQMIQTMQMSGSNGNVTNQQNAGSKKATLRSPTEQFKAIRTSVYNVLREAIHDDLRYKKSVWEDHVDGLDAGQNALLNLSDPVAA